MDDISTRTIIIAVNVFVTIAIVSILIMMFADMREAYGAVANIDTSIYNKFDDIYSMYNGKKVTGIGLLNTIKKYEDQEDVKIIYPESERIQQTVANSKIGTLEEDHIREVEYVKNFMEKSQTYESERFRYENIYNVRVEETLDTVTIIFER